MAYLGSWRIDDFVTFYVNSHATTGVATDADAVPPYRIYEDETGAAIANANMALLDAGNTAGFYSERIQLQAVTGYEKGKQYVIYISVTVGGIEGTIHHTFQIEAEVDANTVSATVDANLIEMGGVAQSATDLKDFADAGYDPGTNQVEGVKLVDTTTTNTDMRGTDNAALAVTALSTAIWTAARAGYLDELAAANLPTDIADLPTVAEFNARTLLAAAYFDAATDPVANVTLVATTTTNTDMRGTDLAALAVNYTAARAAYLDELAAANLPTDITNILSRLPAALVAGRIDASVGAMAANVLTAAALATSAVDEIVDQVWDELIAGHLGAGSTGAALNGASAPTVGQIADAVWDELIAGHLGAGSTGASLNAAGGAGDPWITALPGAYAAGSAGDIIGNLEDDTCSCVTSWYNKYISVLTNFRTGDAITIRRGDTFTLNIERLGDISTRTDIWFTVKEDQDDADTASWIQISETVGLEYINGAAATVPANGSITVTDAVAGDITIWLEAEETAKLTKCAKGYYDIQVLFADGTVSTLVANRATIARDTTRVTS